MQNLGILHKKALSKQVFWETRILGLFAVSSVTKPIFGIPAAIYSAQVIVFYVGHLLEMMILAVDFLFPAIREVFQHKVEKQ